MDALTEKVEQYLADRKVAFSFNELSRNLKIKKRKLERMINELIRKGYVKIAFKYDVAYVMHVHWMEKEGESCH